MKNLLFVIILSQIIFSCKTESENTDTKFYELAILNGSVIDGTGKSSYKANIYLNKDSIAFIGLIDDKNVHIKKSIDATGKIVSPGFIDLHAHGNPIKTPEFKNFLSMGVTTICLGQDGSSPNELDINRYLEKIDKEKLGPNIIHFIGHGTIRNLSGIGIKTQPTKSEMDSMKNILDNNLKYSFGLSTGLEYAPGIYAEKEELLELAQVVGENNRIIMSHMRNEDDDAIFSSINELAEQGKFAPVHISHLKSVYGKGDIRADEILKLIKMHQNNGIAITADIYPYMASYTEIGIVFPKWSKTKKQFELAKQNRKNELEKYIKNKVNQRNGPEATLFGTSPYTGKTLAQLAKEYNKPFEKFLVEDVGPQGASAAYFVMDEVLQNRLIINPLLAICSDGSLTGSHPRGHGTFAKIIEEYVVNENKISLEEAIRKMTSYPASILQLKNRGILKIGNIADILIFNPLKIKAKADYVNPHQLAEGFETVIINGEIIKRDKIFSATQSGQLLLPE